MMASGEEPRRGLGHQPSALSHDRWLRAGEALGAANILLVTIDTFRADRLGVGVAPLDALAASSVRFTSARSAVR